MKIERYFQILICNLQFAIRTSKASRPRRTPGTALPVRKAARVQAVTCLAQLAQPVKRSNPEKNPRRYPEQKREKEWTSYESSAPPPILLGKFY